MARLQDENLIVTPTLLRRFQLEAEFEGGDGRYYGIVLRIDGGLLVHHPGSPGLCAEQLMWAGDVLKFLNRELHHDGAWVVVFTQPKPVSIDNVLLADNLHADYGRYVLLWMDEDGDVQIPIEWEEGTGELRDFADVLLAGLENIGKVAEHAWQAWNEIVVRQLDRRTSETYKRARGERAPSTLTRQ